MQIVDTFQNRLKKAMLLRNIKQVDLVEKTRLDKTLINKYLSGVTNARQTKLTILADALNVNEVWLMGYDVPIERDLKENTNNMFLYKKIKEARLEKNLTQKDLANKLTEKGRKTSNTAIANWESGLNSPDVDTVQLICEILEKDGNYFFDTNADFRYASYNGIDTEGLDDDEIEEINRFVEFIRNKKKNEKK